MGGAGAVANGERRCLPALTSLRFVAAVIVVAHHCVGLFGLPRGPWLAYWAVAFFFVLSGFILTYNYPNLATGRDRTRFLLSRVARVWPAHLFATALWIVLIGWSDIGSTAAASGILLANVFLVQAWIPFQEYGVSLNAVSWSVSNEIAFYLLFLLLIVDWERTWWRKLAVSLGVIVVIAAILRQLQVAGTDPMVRAIMHFHPLVRGFEFVLGMATAHLWIRWSPRARWSKTTGTIVEIVSLAAVIAAIHYLPPLANRLAFRWQIGAAGNYWIVRSAPLLALAQFVAVMALHRGLISRCLCWRPVILLGEISYSVYLIHQIFILFIQHHPAIEAALPPWLGLALYGCGTLVAAYLCWRYVEIPMRDQIMRLVPKKKHLSAPPLRSAA